MRRLLPDPAGPVDPADLDAAYVTPSRPRPVGRPWVLLDMIASVDGATKADGVTASLGGPGDKAVFRALRACADVILVGAETVRAEGYGPPRTGDADRAARLARGQAEWPRIAVVSGRLDLDWSSAMFSASPSRPIVITGVGGDEDRRAAAAEVADVIVTDGGGGGRADLGEALVALGHLGADVVVCEGGPVLNGVLADRDLVDEVCLTLSPTLLGGASHRIAAGHGGGALRPLRLAHVLEDDELVFLRYVRP